MTQPIIISVAPNGARKTKQDHSNIPLTAAEIAKEARLCLETGAALLHLHIRDANGNHTLDSSIYQEVIAAVKKEVGHKLVIQATSEAVGIYSSQQQMQMVKDVRPEAVSLAIKEIIPNSASEKEASTFLAWVLKENILPQYILYSEAELRRFDTLVKKGIIPGDVHSVLFVLGRYSKGQTSSPKDLLDYVENARALECFDSPRFIWTVCAFGPLEAACMATAAALGGNPRIGFENNMYLSNGTKAENNAALISQFCHIAQHMGRPLADADTARALFSGNFSEVSSQQAAYC